MSNKYGSIVPKIEDIVKACVFWEYPRTQARSVQHREVSQELRHLFSHPGSKESVSPLMPPGPGKVAREQLAHTWRPDGCERFLCRCRHARHHEVSAEYLPCLDPTHRVLKRREGKLGSTRTHSEANHGKAVIVAYLNFTERNKTVPHRTP